MGQGTATSKQVQRYALGTVEAGASGISRLSELGANGKHPQNLFRDSKSLFGFPTGCAPIDWMLLRTKAGRKTLHPVMYPRRFFQELYHHRAEVWRERIEGVDGSALEWWENVTDTEFVREHPHLPASVWPTTIPIGMHGDGGAFNKNDQLYTLPFNSLLTSRNSMHTSFFSLLRKSDAVADSLDVVLKHFSWSCNVLLAGEAPHTHTHTRVLMVKNWKAGVLSYAGVGGVV